MQLNFSTKKALCLLPRDRKLYDIQQARAFHSIRFPRSGWRVRFGITGYYHIKRNHKPFFRFKEVWRGGKECHYKLRNLNY